MLISQIEKLKKADCNPPSLFSNVLEMNDSLEYLPTNDFQHMSTKQTSFTRSDPTEILTGSLDMEYDPCLRQSCQVGYQRTNDFDDGTEREVENNFVSRSALSNSVLKGTVRKELQSILKEIRIITDKIRNEVLSSKVIANAINDLLSFYQSYRY